MEGTNKTETRRRLRYRSTEPEQIFWYRIRNRQINNLKFRRQHSIGPFVVDFYCAEKLLVIEIDGDSHATKRGILSDLNRTAFIESKGYQIIRYNNSDIINNIDGVLEDLMRLLT